MKLSPILRLTILSLVSAQSNTGAFTYERLDKNDAALLIVDHQMGLLSIVSDFTALEIRHNVFAHAALGPLFSLPTVITVSDDRGPNGPVPKEILDMHPKAAFIRRAGEVNAWDSPEFQAAVRATNKTQMIVAGIATDVCTTFVALSLREAGYKVWANTWASGTFDERTALEANRRMEHAGVTLMSMFAIVSELMRSWAATPGAREVLPFLDTYLPTYSFVARSHAAAQAAVSGGNSTA